MKRTNGCRLVRRGSRAREDGFLSCLINPKNGNPPRLPNRRMGDVKTFANLPLARATGQQPQHLAYMSHFKWLSFHKHPRRSGANLAKNRSHTAYPARARLDDVHPGTPATAITTNWPTSMSEPVADAHLGIASRSCRNAQMSSNPCLRIAGATDVRIPG